MGAPGGAGGAAGGIGGGMGSSGGPDRAGGSPAVGGPSASPTGGPGASGATSPGAGAASPGGVGTATSREGGAAGSAGPAGAPSRAGAAGGGTSRSPASVALTPEQRSHITHLFTRVNVQPAPIVNFTIAIGAVIPPTVELYEVPAEVEEVVPTYRGYRYFVVRNQIVIVDPSARRIVAVIERSS